MACEHNNCQTKFCPDCGISIKSSTQYFVDKLNELLIPKMKKEFGEGYGYIQQPMKFVSILYNFMIENNFKIQETPIYMKDFDKFYSEDDINKIHENYYILKQKIKGTNSLMNVCNIDWLFFYPNMYQFKTIDELEKKFDLVLPNYSYDNYLTETITNIENLIRRNKNMNNTNVNAIKEYLSRIILKM